MVLTDPLALRAVAHPARQRVIAELYAGAVLTATEAAARCQVTPSAMSYHLRQLEKWGIVTRGEARSDGRERPWRAAGKTLNLAPDAAGSTAALNPIVSGFVQSLEVAARSAITRGGPVEPGRTMRRSMLRLTTDQAVDMAREIDAILDRYDAISDDNDESVRLWDVFSVQLPREDDGLA